MNIIILFSTRTVSNCPCPQDHHANGAKERTITDSRKRRKGALLRKREEIRNNWSAELSLFIVPRPPRPRSRVPSWLSAMDRYWIKLERFSIAFCLSWAEADLTWHPFGVAARENVYNRLAGQSRRMAAAAGERKLRNHHPSPACSQYILFLTLCSSSRSSHIHTTAEYEILCSLGKAGAAKKLTGVAWQRGWLMIPHNNNKFISRFAHTHTDALAIALDNIAGLWYVELLSRYW